MLKKTLLCATVIFALSACGKDGSSAPAGASTPAPTPQTASGDSLINKINNKGTLIVGTQGTYAPFTYHDASGKLTGYDVEVTRAVANKLGVKVEFQETPWDSMLAGLKAGRFDMVANQVALTTPERQAMFDKAEPYSWSGQMLVARKDETRIKTITDIKGIKTPIQLATNYDEVAQKMGADTIPVETMAQALLLVQQKRGDVTLNDSLALLDYLKKNPDSGLKEVWRNPPEEKKGAGLIINKNNEEALAKISSAVNELKQDGTLKRLGEEFFGEDVSVR